MQERKEGTTKVIMRTLVFRIQKQCVIASDLNNRFSKLKTGPQLSNFTGTLEQLEWFRRTEQKLCSMTSSSNLK